MKIVVGLGNPGEKYAKCRHNTGFIVVDEIVNAKGLSWEKSRKLKSEICKNGDVLFLKPQVFMNNSGEAVAAAKEFFGVNAEDILVIHDDVDLAFGQMKRQFGAGHAGHKGVMDIMEKLGTKDFERVRIGIGRPPAESEIAVENFVLKDFSSEELEKIKKVGTLLSEGL
ncbi:MAG: peptidyl-tRNA hydrolase [Patescibacteria group bacterium]|nr:MAG: peptidyl-tRNA hydrolase [Patescibacteria group bacterium]